MAAFVVAATVLAQDGLAAEPELISLAKIWDQGHHNAFTDLIRWHDRWYCTFREADAHVGGNGRLRVLTSTDGDRWESAALVAEVGIDLRDPKLSVTPDDRLMITAGGSLYEGKTLLGCQSRVMFSTNGKDWTAPARVLSEGQWLWRVTWHAGNAYGVAYGVSPTKSKAEAAKRADADKESTLSLFTSTDGLKFNLVTHLEVPGRANETTLRFFDDGEMVALVRRDGSQPMGLIGRSKPPYTQWTWKETTHQIGGPNFIRLNEGTLWAAGRKYPGGAKTALARMTADGGYDVALTLASGGDNSYPGLAWHNGLLWMSYYSSHEGKTAIYLAKIRVPLAGETIGSRLEPMVDDYLVDRMSGSLAFAPQLPKPHEVALVADRPWEGNTSAYFTVFEDDGKLRCYYRGSHFDEASKRATHDEVTCYAESTDGIRFAKPDLGLFEFSGSKANNIVWQGQGSHNFTPFKDTNPACPADSQYRALASFKSGLMAYASADGIHWRALAEEPVITKGRFDSQNLAFWDVRIGKYREYHRSSRKVRDIMTGTSDDFIHWTEPEWLDYPEAAIEHLYTNTVQLYPRAPHVLIGFPTRFLAASEQTEPIFMVSRDGQTFRRYAEPIIPRSAPSDRAGNRSNYMAWGLVPTPGRDDQWSVYAKEAYYSGPASRLRRFTYGRDRLVALAAKSDSHSAKGEMITRPIVFTGSKLVLNYRTSPQGSIRVELQDADGKPIEPFVAASSRMTGDEVAGTVTWSSTSDVNALAGKAVRIRFELENAELFALHFE